MKTLCISTRVGNHEDGEAAITWDVHTPKGDRLQSISSPSVTGIEEALNRAAEVLAPGIDFAVGVPCKMVSKLHGVVGNLGTIADALRVLAGGLKALLEDFNCCLETVGIIERSLPQEGCGMRNESVYPNGASFWFRGWRHVPPRYTAIRVHHT